MISLLYIKIFKVLFSLIRTGFLPSCRQIVKIIVLGHIFILSPNTLSTEYYEKESSSIVLSIGEYRRLPFSQSSSYAMSNKELIIATPSTDKKSLIIRAKHLGVSTLTIWSKNTPKTRVMVQVISKVQKMSLDEDIKVLDGQGLNPSLNNGKLSFSTPVTNLEQLKSLGDVLKKRTSKLYPLDQNIHLEKNFSKQLTSIIYTKLLDSHLTPVECDFSEIPLKCTFEKNLSTQIKPENLLMPQIPIVFFALDRAYLRPNILLKARIILIESATGINQGLGMNALSSKVENILKKDFNSLINNNEVIFTKDSAQISSLATPQMILSEEESATISLGSDIPFTIRTKESSNTQWKFAGLKLTTEVRKNGDKYKLSLETELSKPNAGENPTITSNRLSTSLLLPLDSVTKVSELFHTGVQSQSNSLPYVSSIPLLGKLFSNDNELTSNKHILIYFKLEEI
ncbi:hypothetical protein [Halobacteriovorax sp. HLS]|uniref:hypothetical protein n=1 Tax=Halobacteriovorax sp. HLS TaxID=2234000 RepID=UPI000FDCD088|nr:hypothetical protein [Halobacteriovorax sp. HLS]